MPQGGKVLLVDDRVGDIQWVIDFLENFGQRVERVSNEADARKRFDAVGSGKASYVLAIIDIMVSLKDILDISEVDETFYRKSSRTGVRLCKYLREELRVSADELPIICISGRPDAEGVRKELRKLGIPLYNRVPSQREESLRSALTEYLPELSRRQQ